MSHDTVLHSYQGKKLAQQIARFGYTLVSKYQLQKEETSLQLSPPRNQEGLKKHYSFKSPSSKLEARLNTSMLIGGYSFSKNAPFGMLRVGNKRVLTLPSLRRSKYFVRNFLGMAEILKAAVYYYPSCPGCGAHMQVHEVCNEDGRMMSVHWLCNNTSYHRDRNPISIDLIKPFAAKLSKNALRYWNRMMSKRTSYHKKIAGMKEKPRNIRHVRKEWDIARPYNVTR
ncbi:hypothetical protein KC901_01665 [Patescibacteria group bacterium]|nr:hypothetical protein [Patescibacteria group bacterium]